jgi:hypothetical protein
MDSRYKAWVCVRSNARIEGKNPAGDMDVCYESGVSATERYLVQRSPAECGLSLRVTKCSSAKTRKRLYKMYRRIL